MRCGRFDLIVFDYDGVVADSELLNNVALAEVLSELGLPTSLEDSLAKYLGRRWRDVEPEIAEALGRTCPESALSDWTLRCQARAATELQPVAGFLDFLASRSERRCIASSSPPAWIDTGLRRFGLAADAVGPVFSAAVHVTRGKPHPDLFLHAAETMGVAPDRAVVIEDTTTGVLAGVAAGMTVIGLCAGAHVRAGHAERLRAAGAHHVVDDYAGVAALLDG